MYRFVAKRLLILVPVLLIASLLVFSLLHIAPGDPAQLAAGPLAPPEEVERMRVTLGLNDPFHVQFGRWLGNVTRGDFGVSWRTGEPVFKMIVDRLPATLELMITAMLISLAIGIPLGIIAALRRRTWVDYTCTTVSLFGLSMPNFWQGLMGILVFSVWLGWLPISGHGTIAHLILPAAVLGTSFAAMIARLTRSSMLEVLEQDYIRTARAKGLKERTVIYKHALKNALIPIVTMFTLRLPWLFSGTVVIETVFAWPGMGRLMINSVLMRDFLVIQGILLIFIIMVVISNMLGDLLYAHLNPKVRYG